MKQDIFFSVYGMISGGVSFEMRISTEVRGLTTIFDTGITFDVDELAAHWQKILNAYMVDIFVSSGGDTKELEVLVHTQNPIDLDDISCLASQLRLGIKSVNMAVQGEYMMRIAWTMCEQIPF